MEVDGSGDLGVPTTALQTGVFLLVAWHGMAFGQGKRHSILLDSLGCPWKSLYCMLVLS